MPVHRNTGLRMVVVLALLAAVVAVQAEPLTRQGAVALALRDNPEVKAAQAAWDAARARSRAAWAPPDPEVSVEFEQLQRLGDPGDYAERNVGVAQTIEFPLKWWLSRRAADHEAQVVQAAVYESSRLDVSSRVVIAFDRVLSRQQMLTYEMEHDGLLQEFSRKTRLRHDAGDVPLLAVLRADVEAGRAASRVVAAHNELTVARGRLKALLVRDQASELELSGTLGRVDLLLSLPQVQDLALKRRPDLRGALHEVDGRRARFGAARAGLLPDLTLGVFRQTLREAGASQSLWRLGIALEVPLWGALRQRGDLAAASADLVGAEARGQRLRREVMLDVEIAYRDLITAVDQVKLFDERILHAAEQAQQAAVRSYDAGKATYMEVLDSQRALLQTRTEYVDIVLTCHEAFTALERAAGGELAK